MRGVLAVVALAAAIAVPGVAAASRPATGEEVAGIAAGLGVDAACIAASVSTVDETYARVAGVVDPRCPVGNGFRIVHRSGADWRQRLSGSETNTSCASYARLMPPRVARDLGICIPVSPIPRLVCNIAGPSHKASRAPRDCAILPGDASFNAGADLHRLRWRHWGAGSAFATGASRGFHLYGPWVAIRVVAYRLRLSSCDAPYRVYTRVKVTSRYGSRVYTPDPC